jgi:hypothetical protein
MITKVKEGFIVEVPLDIRKPIISNWSDGTTTLEFYSETFVMEYDTYEYGVPEEKQRKEITLPEQGEFKIIKHIPFRYKNLVEDDSKYYLLKRIKQNG